MKIALIFLLFVSSARADWVELAGSATAGGVSNNSGSSKEPELSIDQAGTPHLAWQDRTPGVSQIFYAYWNGQSWRGRGGSLGSGGVSKTSGSSAIPTLALDGTGRPHLAWEDKTPGNPEIYYVYWNGRSWAELGGSKSGGGVSKTPKTSTNPSLALDKNGWPHIAWMDKNDLTDTEIYYAYWNPQANRWQGLAGSNSGGGVSKNDGPSNAPSLAIDSKGNPHLSWYDGTSGRSEIFYAYWDGDSWEGLAGSNTGHGVSNTPDGDSRYPSLALDPLTDRPYIVWQDKGNGGGANNVYLTYWDGDSWEGLAGSHKGKGISNHNLGANQPDIAFPPNSSNPQVAWFDKSAGNQPHVFYLQWNGTAWETLGRQGELGTDLTNTSFRPALAVDFAGRPGIAWVDVVSGDSDIHFKRWE